VPCEVHKGKQKVAELLFAGALLGFRVELGQLLVDLGPRACDVGPVETGPRRPPLQLLGALERRQRQRDAGQGAFVRPGPTLGRLEFLPARARRGAAEHMRVAPLKHVADRPEHIVQRKMSGFLSHLRVEHDLQLEVAKLAGERVHVVARDRVGDLIGFLDGVGRNRLEALRAVPFAAADRVAKPAHDRHQVFEAHAIAPTAGGLFHPRPVSLIICIM